MRPAAGADMHMPAAAAAAYGASGVEPPPFWSTPTPYLFIGFAVVMGIIAVALAVLLCSRRWEEGRRRGGEEVVPAGMMSVRVLAPLDREAPCKAVVVVVAPGDDAPSFLASATPLAALAEVQRYYGVGGKVVDGAAAV